MKSERGGGICAPRAKHERVSIFLTIVCVCVGAVLVVLVMNGMILIFDHRRYLKDFSFKEI